MTGKEWRVCGRVVGGGKDQIILETAVAMERFSLQYSLLLSCPFSCSKKSHEGNDSKKEKIVVEDKSPRTLHPYPCHSATNSLLQFLWESRVIGGWKRCDKKKVIKG